MGMITANTCCNTAERKHETRNASAQLQIWLAERSASEAAPLDPSSETTSPTTGTGQPINFVPSTPCSAICSIEHISASTSFSACDAGQNAISDEHRFRATGAAEPPWAAIPKMAIPAFTIRGIDLTPSSNNKRVWTNMAYLRAAAESVIAANFHLLSALGRQQPALDFHL